MALPLVPLGLRDLALDVDLDLDVDLERFLAGGAEPLRGMGTDAADAMARLRPVARDQLGVDLEVDLMLEGWAKVVSRPVDVAIIPYP